MKHEIFYKGLGFEEGLSLARLKFMVTAARKLPPN